MNIKLILKFIAYFTVAFLISRVKLTNSIIPFGVAFLISVSNYSNEKITIVTGCGTLLGYVTLYGGNIKELVAYIVLTATIIVINYFKGVKKFSTKKQLIVIFSLGFLEFIVYKLFVLKESTGISLLISLCQLACIYPIYYIINYSMVCFQKYKTRHLYSNEEIISMVITVSIVIAGIGQVTVFGISIRNVLTFILISIISYINGSSIGSAAGVALGMIIGTSSDNIAVCISIFGICGLITGLFKVMGKCFSALAFLISVSIMVIYSNVPYQFKLIEAAISCGVFIAIPDKLYNKLSLEYDISSTQNYLQNGYIQKIKNIFIQRLNSFSEVLSNMSGILNNLVDNDKLAMKRKSSALVENLAASVCGNCSMKSMCWKRELHTTYNAFSELIQNYQENKNIIPQELEKKCVRRTLLIKNTEQTVNNFIISEMWRSRLSEGRELLSSQIVNMAGSVGEIVEELNSGIKFNNDIDAMIRKALTKRNISFNDVMCLVDKNDRFTIKISMKACGGAQKCVKEILPIINDVSKKCMCISDDGCNIDSRDNSCLVVFEEMPKYHISSSVMRECKDGEKYNGDNYYFNKLKDGTYMTIISDGMGSGPQAGQESQAVIDFIEKLSIAGFSKTTVINTVNSLMALKFSENEKFSTVDLNSIDLYSGQAEFIKVGSAASFIKSENKVDVVDSRTLPIGVLDKVDIDIVKKQINKGDIIVMISDGILDYSNESVGKYEWLKEYLENTEYSNPKDISQDIINKAKELGGGRIKDDMTVIVSRVYSLY